MRYAQARLARAYGIEAFCYWHYWFGNGKRILERPFEEVLKSGRLPWQKIKILAIAGALGVIAGYLLDPLTPIIKRICTSSFVIVSGGWCLLALAFSYWLVDMKKWRRGVLFFNVVGMNSLAIYLVYGSKRSRLKASAEASGEAAGAPAP